MSRPRPRVSCLRSRTARGVAFTFPSSLFVLAVLVLALFVPTALADEQATEEDIEAGNAVNVQQRPDSSFIYDTSIEDLSHADSYYDGQTVQVTGEAVGDEIRDSLGGAYRWVTLESGEHDAYISVFMSKTQAERIDTFGEYGSTGTIVQVRGTYHLACQEHEGLSDLHVEEVTVVEEGREHPDSFDVAEFLPGLLLVCVGAALTGLYYFLRERQR